ncbi:autotransporter outer membrane beta-barrel domain-containing protein [uncultured Photobacterium sp.]|uniref:autotransporter outer membrane beta-barrel domain-containing protein n=1 Tax=uncultured Photobacterium sp. TaxID=173973 RepID=UPI00260F7474|nr:autotransporter outer membrane beta-barrel domain-containing protein [uncultured Photobacterium sp.]
MDIITKRITVITPVLIIGTIVINQGAYATEVDSSETITDMISDEVYDAISELMTLASNVRGDKLGKGELSHAASGSASLTNFRGLSGNEMVQRASNLRFAAKQKTLPFGLNFQLSELTLYQDGYLSEQNYSRLGAYVRLDSNSISAANDKAYFLNDANSEIDGYSVTLGGDYLLNDHYLFGVALGLPFNEVESEHEENEIDGLVASGYFSYFHDDWFVDFTASYALMDTDIERRIRHYSDSVFNDTNEADSDIWVFSLGSGYVVDFNYLNVAFESSIQYTLSDTERYTERPSKGNSNYLISKVNNINNLESTMVIAGMSVSHPLRSSLGVFQPYIRGYVHYDIDSGSERIISQLQSDNSGSVLPIIVNTDDSVYGRVHLGLSGAFNRDWYGYAEASSLVGLDELSAYTFTLGVSISLN